MKNIEIKKVLMSVSDKTGLIELAQAFHQQGAEIFASGGTQKALEEAKIPVKPAQILSGSPEAFQGRMKTLSFNIFSGILARRDDSSDQNDLKTLNIPLIDAVVVNFYPFEKAMSHQNHQTLTELIDIGGPALVRAAAKNSPQTLVLTDPDQYSKVIKNLKDHKAVTPEVALECSARAWSRVCEYDEAISKVFSKTKELRYGENPHQKALVRMDDPHAPLDWTQSLTPTELSYNNILDLSHGYELLSDLKALFPDRSICVILKHNHPSGVCVASTQAQALRYAWAGDPVSAFGGVVMFSHPLQKETCEYFHTRFIEAIAAPELNSESNDFKELLKKRKNLKAIQIRHFQEPDPHSVRWNSVKIPGATLFQTVDQNLNEELQCVTKKEWKVSHELSQFGIVVNRSVKSNAVALVAELQPKVYMLLGAGQGQPNRIDALNLLAVPRAKSVLQELKKNTGTINLEMKDLLLVSDAFFPFKDSIETCAHHGIKNIIQPGGSIKDLEVIQAADEYQISMAFTGKRHFKH